MRATPRHVCDSVDEPRSPLMFCSKCGNRLAEGSVFCQVCGAAAPTAVASAPGTAVPGTPAFAAPMGQVAVSPHWLPTPTRTYAGFWLRLVAAIIDSTIVGAVSGALFFPLMAMTGLGTVLNGIKEHGQPDPAAIIAMLSSMPLLIGIAIAGKWLYFAYCESSEWQATPGKKVLNLTVTDMDGNRISFARASG